MIQDSRTIFFLPLLFLFLFFYPIDIDSRFEQWAPFLWHKWVRNFTTIVRTENNENALQIINAIHTIIMWRRNVGWSTAKVIMIKKHHVVHGSKRFWYVNHAQRFRLLTKRLFLYATECHAEKNKPIERTKNDFQSSVCWPKENISFSSYFFQFVVIFCLWVCHIDEKYFYHCIGNWGLLNGVNKTKGKKRKILCQSTLMRAIISTIS